MTTVNWERLEGGTIEQIVAALLLLKHPNGNRITPSRGDRGVDVQVRDADGTFTVYQIKRYTGPLTSRQATEITRSWQRFVEETLPGAPIRSWILVTPWDPTHERLEWLRQLTAGHELDITWIGRTLLDAMAAGQPAVVGYYLGDGAERIHELMRMALSGGAALPAGPTGEGLLDAIAHRQRSLAATLNAVDPFYRYELEVHLGQVSKQDLRDDKRNLAAAFVRMTQLDKDYFQILRLQPRCQASTELRPIRIELKLEDTADSADLRSVEEYLRFGAPFDDIPVRVLEFTGPPGVDGRFDRSRWSVVPLPLDPAFPEVEIRAVAADGQLSSAVELWDVELTRGVGGGFWLRGRDRSRALCARFYFDDGPRNEIRLDTTPLEGKAPADVLPMLQLLTDLVAGSGLELAIRGGPALTGRAFGVGETVAEYARLHLPVAAALVVIQRHTVQRVTVPDLNTVTTEEARTLLATARMLAGQCIDVAWDGQPLHITKSEELPPPGGEEFTLVSDMPMMVRLGPQEIALDVRQRVYYLHVRVADPDAADRARPGDRVELMPGADTRALFVAVRPNR